MKLDQQFFESVKPGLSSFADEPKKGAETIRNLLNKAKESIPASVWHSTPLVLKATAGLRLLSPEKADRLLSEVLKVYENVDRREMHLFNCMFKVRKVFDESGFMVTDQSVDIMDGIDEGLFSWFTINFLLSTGFFLLRHLPVEKQC